MGFWAKNWGGGGWNLEFRMENFGAIVVFGLKMGILGGAFGHLVFGNEGVKRA